MKEISKQILSLLLVLGLTMVLVESSFGDFSLSKDTGSCNDCQGIADHFEHTHFHGLEYFTIFNESKSNPIHCQIKKLFISSCDIHFESEFIINIWQPPKVF